MNLAAEIERLRGRGFDEESAQIVVLMREAAILLFEAFPEAFLLYGGANLILFHDSLRTSRDLDLLSRGAQIPEANGLAQVLVEGLQELGKLLGWSPLAVKRQVVTAGLLKLEVAGGDGRSLFTVDLGGLGSVLQTGIEERALEAVSLSTRTTIKLVSRNHLLLQKAEAFVFRRGIKARDAYDIRLLLHAGAALPEELENHLSDALAMREIGSEELADRIEQVTAKLCHAQLAGILPAGEYRALEREGFEPLQSALKQIFGRWL
jgi:hypothetical protein